MHYHICKQRKFVRRKTVRQVNDLRKFNPPDTNDVKVSGLKGKMLDHYPVIHFASTWLQVEWSNKYSFFWFITEKKVLERKRKKILKLNKTEKSLTLKGQKVIYNIKRLYKQEPLVYRKQSKVPKKVKKINNDNQSIMKYTRYSCNYILLCSHGYQETILNYIF